MSGDKTRKHWHQFGVAEHGIRDGFVGHTIPRFRVHSKGPAMPDRVNIGGFQPRFGAPSSQPHTKATRWGD
jgi:hypothetical protein